jgi:hypothetical protein
MLLLLTPKFVGLIAVSGCFLIHDALMLIYSPLLCALIHESETSRAGQSSGFAAMAVWLIKCKKKERNKMQSAHYIAAAHLRVFLIKAPPGIKLKGHTNMFGDLRNRQETCSNAQSVCVRPRQENTKYSFASLLAIGCLVFFFTLARHLFDGSTANQGRLDDYQGGTVRICVL